MTLSPKPLLTDPNATEGSSRHIIDPAGDVEIVLKNPNRQFLLHWHYEETPTPQRMKMNAKRDKARQGKLSGQMQTEAIEAADLLDRTDSNAACLSAGYHTRLLAQFTRPEPDVTILASSSHLSLASETFSKMLRGGDADDPVKKKCTASEWDTDAFTIVLCIIHGRHRAIPATVELETLAKIAVILDYYRCHEATEVFLQRWIETEPCTATSDAPESMSYGPDCMLWMFVAWIFRQRKLFRKMARLAVMQSSGPLQTMGLPFPKTLIDTLEAKRQSLMRETYDVIQNLVDDLIQDQHCNSLCSSALIGCFMRQIRSTGIDGLDWGGDIRGCSVQCLCDLVSGFTTPELVIEHGPNGSLRSKVHLCSVSKKLAEYGFLPAAKVSENLGVEALGYPSDD